jgi:transcription initiation factor IIE alpha subunit
MYACIDCGWPWPLASAPPDGAECDNCGGDLEEQEEAGR